MGTKPPRRAAVFVNQPWSLLQFGAHESDGTGPAMRGTGTFDRRPHEDGPIILGWPKISTCPVGRAGRGIFINDKIRAKALGERGQERAPNVAYLTDAQNEFDICVEYFHL
jgi:hypothetical protein